MQKFFCSFVISLFLSSALILPQFVFPNSADKFVIGSLPVEGFFSSFLGVLVNIMWADKNHKVPVVHWSKQCLYAQKERYNGSFNPWEYYFDPVSPLIYKKGDIVHQHFYDPNGFSIYDSFHKNPENFDKSLRFAAKETMNKYIKVKPNILKKVRSFYEKNMKDKVTIGIHLRGTDKVDGKKKQEIKTLIMNAAERIAGIASDKVQFYIATDEIALLNFAREVSQHPVIYQNCYRSESDHPIHRKKIDNHRANGALGEEVLIDMLLLSKCDFLIHSLSSVAITALIYNPNLPHENLWTSQKHPEKQPHLLECKKRSHQKYF